MKKPEDVSKELDEITQKTFEKAQELSELLKEYEKIDLESDIEDEDEDSEENQKFNKEEMIKAFYSAVNTRRQAVLRRLLAEWGGLLFM